MGQPRKGAGAANPGHFAKSTRGFVPPTIDERSEVSFLETGTKTPTIDTQTQYQILQQKTSIKTETHENTKTEEKRIDMVKAFADTWNGKGVSRESLEGYNEWVKGGEKVQPSFRDDDLKRLGVLMRYLKRDGSPEEIKEMVLRSMNAGQQREFGWVFPKLGEKEMKELVHIPNCPPEILELCESVSEFKYCVKDRKCPYCGTLPGPNHESYRCCPNRSIEKTNDDQGSPPDTIKMDSTVSFDRVEILPPPSDKTISDIARNHKESFANYIKDSFSGTETQPGELLRAGVYAATPEGQNKIIQLKENTNSQTVLDALDSIETVSKLEGATELEIALEKARIENGFRQEDRERSEYFTDIQQLERKRMEESTSSIILGKTETSVFDTSILGARSHAVGSQLELSFIGQNTEISFSKISKTYIENNMWSKYYRENETVKSKIDNSVITGSYIRGGTISNSTVRDSKIVASAIVKKSTIENDSFISKDATIEGSSIRKSTVGGGTKLYDSDVSDSRVGWNSEYRDSRISKTTISDGATVIDSEVVGSKVEIDTSLIRAKIGSGGTISQSVFIKDSQLGRGVSVGRDARLFGVSIPDNVTVPAGTEVFEQEDVRVVSAAGTIWSRFPAEGHSFWRHKYVYGKTTIDIETGEVIKTSAKSFEELGALDLTEKIFD